MSSAVRAATASRSSTDTARPDRSIGSPTRTQTGRPGRSEPGPDFCHTGEDPQLTIGRIGTPVASARRNRARLACHGKAVLATRDGPLRIHHDDLIARERLLRRRQRRRPGARPARNGDLPRARHRPADAGRPEQILFGEETRAPAGAHDRICVGEWVEIGRVVARDDRGASQRDALEPVEPPPEPQAQQGEHRPADRLEPRLPPLDSARC